MDTSTASVLALCLFVIGVAGVNNHTAPTKQKPFPGCSIKDSKGNNVPAYIINTPYGKVIKAPSNSEAECHGLPKDVTLEVTNE